MAADTSDPAPILTEWKENDNGKAAVTKNFRATKNIVPCRAIKNIGSFLDKDTFLWYCSLEVSNN